MTSMVLMPSGAIADQPVWTMLEWQLAPSFQITPPVVCQPAGTCSRHAVTGRPKPARSTISVVTRRPVSSGSGPAPSAGAPGESCQRASVSTPYPSPAIPSCSAGALPVAPSCAAHAASMAQASAAATIPGCCFIPVLLRGRRPAFAVQGAQRRPTGSGARWPSGRSPLALAGRLLGRSTSPLQRQAGLLPRLDPAAVPGDVAVAELHRAQRRVVRAPALHAAAVGHQQARGVAAGDLGQVLAVALLHLVAEAAALGRGHDRDGTGDVLRAAKDVEQHHRLPALQQLRQLLGRDHAAA